MFDNWLEETGTYFDQYCLDRVQKKFDQSMGLEHYEYIAGDKAEKEDAFRFRMIDGQKYMLAILKYNLYDDTIV